MHQAVTIHELSLVVPIRNCKPELLSAELLKYSGIVPMDWELAQPPIQGSQGSQILFQNGVGASAQADRVVFVEVMGQKLASEMTIPAIAQRYIETLPYADYHALGINFRGYLDCDGDPDAASRYLTQTLLAAGSWQEFGTAPLQAALQLTYPLEEGELNLSINDATIEFTDQPLLSVILFSGNFNYDLNHGLKGFAPEPGQNPLSHLLNLIRRWEHDLDLFKTLINQHFLSILPLKNVI